MRAAWAPINGARTIDGTSCASATKPAVEAPPWLVGVDQDRDPLAVLDERHRQEGREEAAERLVVARDEKNRAHAGRALHDAEPTGEPHRAFVARVERGTTARAGASSLRLAQVSEREHDIVLFGATSFVGRLTAEYLPSAAPEGTRVALAGRSAERLQALRTGLGAEHWPIVVADTSDPAALRAMAAGTTVLATHGRPLPPLRHPGRGGLRGGRHPLRGPDRRGRVHARVDRPLRRRGARARRAHRPQLRLRLDPLRHRRPAAARAGCRRRRRRARRHRAGRRARSEGG